MTWSGVVAVDKPMGWTSRQVVDRVANIVRKTKVGHAGTLDPLATGVLLVAIGPATRLISYLQQGHKRYVGGFRLGQCSNTNDIEGQVVDGGDWSNISASQVSEGISQFVGVTQQVPPQFSAVHVDGQRAYALARKGEHVELEARPVEVFSIKLTRFQPPDLELEIVCGSGTYVRSIGRDLGEWLGCGAIMTSLRRMSVGPFNVDSSIAAESIAEQTLRNAIQPPIQAVANLPRRIVVVDEIRSIRQGKVIETGRIEGPELGTEVVLIDESGQLVAIARLSSNRSCLQPCVVLSPAS